MPSWLLFVDFVSCDGYDPASCSSTINSENGGVQRPNAATLAQYNVPTYFYSYFLSAGSTPQTNWSVNAALVLSQDTSVGVQTTSLGDYYVKLTNITGRRNYTFLYPNSNVRINSTVTNATLVYPNNVTTQFLYPLAGVGTTTYTPNNAPYFDVGGIGFGLTPGVYPDGNYRYPSSLFGALALSFAASPSLVALSENPTGVDPNQSRQRQSLSLTRPSGFSS